LWLFKYNEWARSKGAFKFIGKEENMPNLIDVYILPPAAVGRLGGSSRPLENYEWRTDPSIHGASQTVIEPITTLDVADDGIVAPYRPGIIRFRDGKNLRPVAPFFELWVRIQYRNDDPPSFLEEAGAQPDELRDVPLTASLLRLMGGSTSGITYRVRLSNRKAARRTGDDANIFEAVLRIKGDDNERKSLLAFTPPRPGLEPLVFPDRPIPLGSFQVMKPVRRIESEVDLDVLRFRYTPGQGQVYGPPTAVEARGTTADEIFEIVPPVNRILNPRSSWLRYDGSYSTYVNPEPWDTYDGADQDQNVSWGVVDDTCDGIIQASVVVGARRFEATARVFVGPPDYAPDRRPFLSLADDLVDRDQDPASAAHLANDGDKESIKASVADLFERVFETASLINLDAIRRRAIGDNRSFPPGAPNTTSPPFINERSMTPDDVGYSDDRVQAIVPNARPGTLQFTPLVGLAHAPLAHNDELWAFLRNHAERARKMLRPAFGAFSELTPVIESTDPPAPTHRDPRIDRDLAHDMRMPPYMRDEMARALSLTRRQYIEVLRLIDALEARKPAAKAPMASAADTRALTGVAGEGSDLRQRVRAVLARAQAHRKP
jgi:hypothetical protein